MGELISVVASILLILFWAFATVGIWLIGAAAFLQWLGLIA